MPIYTLQAPDGKTYDIEGPEGATADQLASFIQSQGQAEPQPQVNKELASFGNRFATGLTDPIHGGAQALTHALPEGITSSVNRATQYVNELPVIGPVTKALGMTPATSQQIDTGIQERERELQSARAAAGQTGIDMARLGGNVVSTLPLAAAVPGAGSAGILARTGASTAGSLLAGGTAPVSEGDYGEQKRNQLMIGGALGALAPTVANAASRVIRPNTSQQVQTLMNEGVTPTPGQILGGIAARTEEKLTSVPLLGDVIKGAQQRTKEDFNRAALARALKTINQTPSGAVGREGVQEVKQALGSAYDNLLPKLQFKADQQFSQEIGNLSSMVKNGNVPPEIAKQFDSILKNEVLSRMTKQGAMDGQAFKNMEGALSPKIKSFMGSQNPNDRELGAALSEVLNSARGVLTRTNPKYAEELKNINTGYANYSRIRDAASRQGAEEGVFTPAQLSAAIRAADKSAGKGQFATGNALMQDLSEAGKGVISSKVPNSGTVDRLLMGGALGAGGMVNPMIPLAAGATMLPYTQSGQRLMASVLARRPSFAEPIAQGVRRSAPAISSASYPAVQGRD